MPLLQIPFHQQTEPMYCHPTCVKMVLDYAIDTLEINQKKISLKTIAASIGATPHGGTSPERIEDVNVLLGNSYPPISFKVVIPGNFRIIRGEIDQNRPVIAWLNLIPDEDDTPWHAVLINGYAEDRREIYYIDPNLSAEHSQKAMEMGAFIDNHLGKSGRLVTLVISEEGQRDLYGRIIAPKKRRRRRSK